MIHSKARGHRLYPEGLSVAEVQHRIEFGAAAPADAKNFSSNAVLFFENTFWDLSISDSSGQIASKISTYQALQDWNLRVIAESSLKATY